MFNFYGQSNSIKDCGPGFMFTNSEGIATWLNILSLSSYPITTGASTSGTSKCKGILASTDSLKLKRIKLITNNFELLKENIAKGEGELLNSLLVDMDCDEKSIIINLKNNYDDYFESKHKSLLLINHFYEDLYLKCNVNSYSS